MRFPIIILSLLGSTGAVFAECATPEVAFMSCTFSQGANQVHVCLEGENVTYGFGPAGGAPKLSMSVPIAEVDYMPWPGVSSIWERMTFHVGSVSYVVAAGETRIYPEDENENIDFRLWGSIEVYQNYEIVSLEKELITLTCDEGSVIFDWNRDFSNAKRSAGQCWSGQSFSWQACDS